MRNSGVKGAIDVVFQSVAGLLSFWISDDLSNNVWGQVGYYVYGSSAPIAFYQIWDLNSNIVLSGGMTTVAAGYHTFSMYLLGGTTWAFALDGHMFGSYNMGATISSSSYPVYAMSEEASSTPFPFTSVKFSSAMQVMKSGVWQSVTTAKSYGNEWGVGGHLQSSGLGDDQIMVGTSVRSIPAESTLWTIPPPQGHCASPCNNLISVSKAYNFDAVRI
jgi:hypothetical protein